MTLAWTTGMTARGTRNKWVGLICDATGASVFAARGSGSRSALIARAQIEYDVDVLQQKGGLASLREIVQTHQLRGCDAHLLFVGAGTVVQPLTLPAMSHRHRAAAVRTRLTSYAGGRELIVGVRLDGPDTDSQRTHLLAAGVDRRLVEGLYRISHEAGLRLRVATALAAAFAPPPEARLCVQIVLGDRTSTIQLFENDRLVSCRDTLLGRLDFVSAYQRPILANDGPLTLSAADADALVREVGVPFQREDDVWPGVGAAQLWPLVMPVLQKLQNEIQQTIAHARSSTYPTRGLRVLSFPVVPGLNEHLAAEMDLECLSIPLEQVDSQYLSALSGGTDPDSALDLRPAHERFAERMLRPAFAAAACALLVILANSTIPREAHARLAELEPLSQTVQAQLHETQRRLAAGQNTYAELAARVNRQAKLEAALPAEIPALGALKSAYACVPHEIELEQARLQSDKPPTTLTLRGTYRGGASAAVVAAEWTRRMSDSAFFANAKVKNVRSRGGDATIEIEARLR